MQNFSMKRLNSVIPILADKFRAIRTQLFDRHKITIEVVSGLRTFAEQNELFAQGRTKRGNVVTNARAGESFHNFGLAIDVCPYLSDSFDWTDDRVVWLTIANCAKLYGLESGWFWRHQDKPHLQISAGFSLVEINAFNRVGGLPLVWKKVEEKLNAKN